MQFNLHQLFFLSITFGQLLNVSGRAVPVQNSGLSDQLNARAICCGSGSPSPPPSARPPSTPLNPVTAQPGLITQPNAAPKSSTPNPQNQKTPKAKTPTTIPSTSGQSNDAQGQGSQVQPSQVKAEAQGRIFLVNDDQSRTYAIKEKYYKVKIGKESSGLEQKNRNFLSVPLKEQPALIEALFKEFEVKSVRPAKTGNGMHMATFRATYSEDGISISWMGKVRDGNKAANRVPASGLMAQGALRMGSRPTFVFMKKIKNTETVDVMEAALKEKHPNGKNGDWSLQRASTDVTEQKWFNTLLGTDNGRPVEQMARTPGIDKKVTSIYISQKQPLMMAFLLGPLHSDVATQGEQ